MRDRIEHDAHCLECCSRSASAEERLDARDELDQRKRLGDIVVSARVEACDTVDDCIACGEKEHRDLDPARPQRLADVTPVGIGQPDVDDEDVGQALFGAGEHVAAVGDGVHVEAFLTKAATEHAPELGVVLDDQHLACGHRAQSLLAACGRGSAAAAPVVPAGGSIRPAPPLKAEDADTRGANSRLRMAPMVVRAL